jgi:hypothetical protein
MGASFLLAVLIAQASPASPASTPPPTIVNVQAKNRVCAAIQESIAPSIAGLLQNDHTIVDGVYFLNKWSGDGGTLRAHMDMMHVENDVSGIVRNLSAVNRLLESTEPADTPAAEAQRIEGMKKSLRDVARQQLMTLNVLDGTLETSQMNEFMDTSNLPNFAAPDTTTAGFHAAPLDALDGPGKGASAGLHSWTAAQAGDFFSLLKQSEDAAAVAVVAGSVGCTRIDHSVAPPK